LSAGAKVAYLIEEPLAAAIGAKIPIAAPSGNMIMDIGGGSAEAAVISLGGVVVHKSVRVAGNKIDEAITAHMRKRHNLVIGEVAAEQVKIQVGSAVYPERELKMEVKGRDFVSGLPRIVTVTGQEIHDAIKPVLLQIITAAKGVLEDTPPELASDIIDKGIVMSGGTSTLRDFDKLMTSETGVPCHVAEDALLCVVRGTGVALENIDLYKRSITRR
jgi:rod shape-determining protein MreB and related proteins